MKKASVSSLSLRMRLEVVLHKLEENQGVKSWLGPADPLEVLILTLLSQNTNDQLRDRAFQRLRQRFQEWGDVLKAPVAEVEAAIQVAGLSKQKAARMQELLRWVQAYFGGFTLSTLQEMNDDQAITLLRQQKGIGIKTAAVTLMVAFGRDLCPVDTHVHRISRRLGWTPESASAEATFDLLRPQIPAGRGYSLHMNLLQFGRNLCRARNPQCQVCFLWDECVWEGKLIRA